MKGRGCRKSGGSVNLGGGVKAPAYGSNKSVLSEAKSGSTGIVKMDGPDGGPSKGRLDKPGRRFGGKVKGKSKDTDHDGDCD
jgi:hypothetical protein